MWLSPLPRFSVHLLLKPQYLGRMGKVDRGQVAVFGVLAKGQYATAIDSLIPSDAMLPSGPWQKAGHWHFVSSG